MTVHDSGCEIETRGLVYSLLFSTGEAPTVARVIFTTHLDVSAAGVRSEEITFQTMSGSFVITREQWKRLKDHLNTTLNRCWEVRSENVECDDPEHDHLESPDVPEQVDAVYEAALADMTPGRG